MTWDWVTCSCTNLLEPKKVLTYEEGSARTKLVWNTTNMAAVKSCENALYSQSHRVDTSPNHLYNNNNNHHHHHQWQRSSLAANGWIAEEPERWDRTSACKGVLCCCFSPCLISSRPSRPITAHTAPLFSNNVTDSFKPPSNWYVRMKETRPTA